MSFQPGTRQVHGRPQAHPPPACSSMEDPAPELSTSRSLSEIKDCHCFRCCFKPLFWSMRHSSRASEQHSHLFLLSVTHTAIPEPTERKLTLPLASYPRLLCPQACPQRVNFSSAHIYSVYVLSSHNESQYFSCPPPLGLLRCHLRGLLNMGLTLSLVTAWRTFRSLGWCEAMQSVLFCVCSFMPYPSLHP